MVSFAQAGKAAEHGAVAQLLRHVQEAVVQVAARTAQGVFVENEQRGIACCELSLRSGTLR
ncbi:hypothetical protein [Streptomyces sp. NPDC102487]|uniref:hypothetical protein n=1 Tax=Streptomyces sp. NPDC102487 TaxID=3366182 RepID=UPI0038102C8D